MLYFDIDKSLFIAYNSKYKNKKGLKNENNWN